MKNNIGFFTTEIEALDERRHLILRAYYGGDKGWAMESRFYGLQCLLGRAEGCRLDLSQKGEKARIARALELSLVDLEEFLNVLKTEAELLQEENGRVWVKEIDEDLERAMAARVEASNRRKGKETPASADNSKTSADKLKTSADKTHGEEGRGKERSREEGGRKSPAAPVDNFPEDQEPALFAFALQRILARKKRPGDPDAMARKIMHEPDVIADFNASRSPAPSPPAERLAPAPGPCDCKGTIRWENSLGEGKCLECGAWWRYDWTWELWKKDPIPQTG